MAVTGVYKYGIFWIPTDHAVNSFIQNWKQQVGAVEPEAQYLNHPAHSTIFLFMGSASDEESILAELESFGSRTWEVPTTCSGWQVFRNDAVTGADTFALGLDPSAALLLLQQQLTELLLPFRRGSLNYPVQWQGHFLDAYQRCGFPFSGPHWLPHVTVASVKHGGRAIMNNALIQSAPPDSTTIDNIALYRIEGEVHTHIKTIQLQQCA